MNRRAFIATSAAVLVPTSGWALNPGKATKLVERLVADVNAVIASGKSEQAMYKDFEKIFARYSDTKTIAAYAMGVDGRRATGAQKKAFTSAFQAYISRKYGKRFREFIGGKLEVTSTKTGRNAIEVSTTAFLRGQSPFEVTFFVSDKSGKDLFFNMYIEGINMLLVERDEVGRLLDRNGGNIDKMIAALKTAG